MKNTVSKLTDKLIYSIESIKNRYPCRIIRIRHASEINEETIITFYAATKLNIITCTLKELLENKSIIEKFHPQDCIVLGFLSAKDFFRTTDINSDPKIKFLKITNDIVKQYSIEEK